MEGWWRSLFGFRSKPVSGNKTDSSTIGRVIKDTFDANKIGADLEPGLERWKEVNNEWRKDDNDFTASDQKHKLDVSGISDVCNYFLQCKANKTTQTTNNKQQTVFNIKHSLL